MPSFDPKANPQALAVTSSAIVAALLDALVQKQVLSVNEIRAILDEARRDIGRRDDAEITFAGNKMISALLRSYPEVEV